MRRKQVYNTSNCIFLKSFERNEIDPNKILFQFSSLNIEGYTIFSKNM